MLLILGRAREQAREAADKRGRILESTQTDGNWGGGGGEVFGLTARRNRERGKTDVIHRGQTRQPLLRSLAGGGGGSGYAGAAAIAAS